MIAKEESCNVWHSVFGEDKQTKESQDYNKVTIRPPVLFRQKGKCRIIWYCPIAVKGEVCGNYWTVLDSSPPVFPLLLKIQPSWCDEETWPDQKKDKRQYIFSPFENPHDDDRPGDDTLSISILICHILLIKFYVHIALFIHFVCLTWILNDPNSNYSS